MSITNPTAKNFQKFYNGILPYLNGAVHSGFTPIGTVISVMGTTAPLNYLACDGTVYNIADYTELAAYFNQQFGSSNFFGGDGTTTFAVPDLRGEFLRGTGTNSHANQGSGANVGVHQDGTEHPYCYGQTYIAIPNTAAIINKDSSPRFNIARDYVQKTGSDTDGSSYTSRPTNTSVLYCIASKNIFMDAGSNYSTEEQVVGTWIDGKPIYQKSVQVTLPTITDGTWGQVEWNIASLNVNEVISLKYLARQVVLKQWTDGFYMSGDGHILKALHINDVLNNNYAIRVMSNSASYSNGKCYITLQYTKTTD